MNIEEKENGVIEIKLEPSDVESAVRQFICACHPKYAKGYIIEVVGTTECTASIKE